MGEMTLLLERVATGDRGAHDALYRLMYPELMRLARGHLGRAGTISLDSTALVHECYMRLPDGAELPHASRRVFFAYASKVMHSVIVDYVRDRGAQKRGGGAESVTLSGVADALFTEHSIMDIEEALSALARIDERAYRVVEMRYFGGMNEDDIASVLDVSLATVGRDWRKARAFLYERLG